VSPPVKLSHPVVEAGIYDSGNASALVLGNFTYSEIPGLEVECDVGFKVKQVRSAEQGSLDFKQSGQRLKFQLPLGISDIVRMDP